MYRYEREDLEFGKGTLAELIAYDRYAICDNDARNAKVGQIVRLTQFARHK